MKYSKVEIRKVNRLSKSGNKYEVTFEDLDGDRYNENLLPNALGFYYYESRIGKKKAFEELRKKMIDTYTKGITNLEYAIKQLEELEINL